MKKIKILTTTLLLTLVLTFGFIINKPKAQTDNWILNTDDGYYYYDFGDGLDVETRVVINVGKNERVEYMRKNAPGTYFANYYDKEFDRIEIRMQLVQFSVYAIPTYYADFYYGNKVIGNATLTEYDPPNTNIRKINQFDIPGENLTDISDLPLTAPDRLGTVLYEVTGSNVKIQINYNNNVYYLFRSFTAETDMKIFETIESYYMNINNNPQFIINHSDRPYLRDILEAPEGEKPAFVPHTIWDLKTNKLETINTYTTYAYIKQNERGVMISYVYIDEFIIDHLLTAEISWASRQKNAFLVLGGKYTDWKYNKEILTSSQYLEHYNLTRDWQDFVPVWNIVRAIYKFTTTYEMPRIQAVNLNNPQADYNITKNELETHFKFLNKDFNSIKTNPRYKVWALALQQGKSWGKVQTEVYHNPNDLDDPMNLKIINLSYYTNGVLYEAVGNDMDLLIKVEDKIDGIKNEKDSNVVRTIIVVAVFVGYIMILNANKGFKSFNQFIKVTLIYGLIVVLGLFVFNVIKLPGLIILRL